MRAIKTNTWEYFLISFIILLFLIISCEYDKGPYYFTKEPLVDECACDTGPYRDCWCDSLQPERCTCDTSEYRDCWCDTSDPFPDICTCDTTEYRDCWCDTSDVCQCDTSAYKDNCWCDNDTAIHPVYKDSCSCDTSSCLEQDCPCDNDPCCCDISPCNQPDCFCDNTQPPCCDCDISECKDPNCDCDKDACCCDLLPCDEADCFCDNLQVPCCTCDTSKWDDPGCDCDNTQEPRPLYISYKKSVQPIWNKYCIECHVDGGSDPILTTEESYDAIIDGGYITTYNVSQSSIYSKVESGEMPDGQPKIPQVYIDTIYLWLQQGFKNNK